MSKENNDMSYISRLLFRSFPPLESLGEKVQGGIRQKEEAKLIKALAVDSAAIAESLMQGRVIAEEAIVYSPQVVSSEKLEDQSNSELWASRLYYLFLAEKMDEIIAKPLLSGYDLDQTATLGIPPSVLANIDSLGWLTDRLSAAEAAAASTPAPLIPWHMNFSAEEAVRSRRKFPRRARR